MAAAGFDDRAFPDGRVLRMCTASDDLTIAQIGRALGVTRQGASKIVAGLRDRGYVTVVPSPTNGREKIVTATPRAHEYLESQRKAARAIERRLHTKLGPEAFTALRQLLDHLGGGGDLRLRDYLHKMGAREI
jgi:DNA-binding MarR family transcriptional regulator